MKKIILAFNLICAVGMNSQSTSDKDALIASLQNEIRDLSKKNEELKEEILRLKSSPYGMNKTAGEEYRVQLGLQNPDRVFNSLSAPKPIMGSYINGKMVYDIAGFNNADDAYNLSQELRKLNLAGAFVTRYINGQRDFSYTYPLNGQSNYSRFTPNSSSSIAPYGVSKTNTGTTYYIKDGVITTGTVAPAKKSSTMIIEDDTTDNATDSSSK